MHQQSRQVDQKLQRSPYISSRHLDLSVPPSPQVDNFLPLHDVLAPGDVVGVGIPLQGELIRLVSAPLQGQAPAAEFEVITQLGTGSYAVVYLVHEVISRPPPSDDGHDMPTIGPMDLDVRSTTAPSPVYGRKYALKCLSKANLDDDALALQMTEVTIHQSLPPHPNIVTLHSTWETSDFLLLLLEYVPGEDLFYFLEQARDHYDPDLDPSLAPSCTPPTPSLLSNLHPAQLLSRTRLRLIASMFAQMCDAVAACHAQNVFHRDIKPENFIVTDGLALSSNGSSERKVVVKLTDFGLSTTDVESSDMDCGSAPYMSYECRNNVAPTYRPGPADVWSLGIVLINMLYHYNPWTDTAHGVCNSFDLYRKDPVNFFLHRFTGMTRPVAETLAHRVFCILDDPQDHAPRMSAAEFGSWARNLPTLLGGHVPTTIPQPHGHRLSMSIPVSHRPSSRQPSVSGSLLAAARTPAIPPRSLSRAPSLQPALEKEELSNHENLPHGDIEPQDTASRSTSTHKRRKRGQRKSKASSAANAASSPQDDTLLVLAAASQTLAREISMASKASGSRNKKSLEPVYSMPPALLSGTRLSSIAPPPSSSTLPKKPSKWKLSFGKNSGQSALSQSGPSTPPPVTAEESDPQGMSQTASSVTKLIMGLYAPPGPEKDKPVDPAWSRGRRERENSPPRQVPIASHNSNSNNNKTYHRSPLSNPPTSHPDQWSVRSSDPRAVSPNSTRSGRPIGSSASSVASSNWRSSMSTTSSAGTSTSAFTRFSNNSTRSISTTATSVSSTSWRTSVKPGSTYSQNNIPRNIKLMDGVPWELDQLPRGQHPNPVGDIFGSPPTARKQQQPRRKPAKDGVDTRLDTINERPNPSWSPPPPVVSKSFENMRRDASTSTTDLTGISKDDSESVNKKVQKGQIQVLAKMLSALRR